MILPQHAHSVVIRAYDAQWPEWFHQESQRLFTTCKPFLHSIEHIGSTAVEGLSAKPIIDMMILVPDQPSADHCRVALIEMGYVRVLEFSNVLPGRFEFLYRNNNNVRQFHVHLADAQSDFPIKHLAFRNYLRAHPHTSQAYQALKQSLASQYPDDSIAYSNGKATFIEAVLTQALPQNTSS